SFPPEGTPRILWGGVAQGSGELSAIANRLTAELRSRQLPTEGRPFSAHCTLGRPPSGWTGTAAWDRFVHEHQAVIATEYVVARHGNVARPAPLGVGIRTETEEDPHAG